MSTIPPQSDITVRGGLINVPALTSPTTPPRHQPNTPRNKKTTTVKADHIHAPSKQDPDTPDAPPINPDPADPSDSTTKGETDNVPTPPSKSD